MVKNSKTGGKFAAKCFQKSLIGTSTELQSVANEVEINLELNHPNVAKMVEIQETENSLYLIFEYLSGGRIGSEGRRSTSNNEEIKNIIFSILKAVEHLEDKKIVHRDIKPSNIMFDHDANSDRETQSVKIIDFGLSSSDPEEIRYICGTPEYIAPELFSASDQSIFNSKIDVFSIGVIFYIFQFGHLPSQISGRGENNFQVENFSEQSLDLSDFLAYDLLVKMLNSDQSKRLSIQQCLLHPYFSSITSPLNKPLSSI